jgi:hypothetical protein
MIKGKGLAKIMDESNCKSLDIISLTKNIMETKQGEDETQEPSSKVSPKVFESNW